MSEDAAPNTLVATVQAFDPDGDRVTYEISEGNKEGNFVIDPQKGNHGFRGADCGVFTRQTVQIDFLKALY